ncbi:hypothetical protein NQ314_005796 [Rhamnusium bicolor]|uniref:MICOS complex subunit MIC13 n=1 Tax=Rhamnusium bicolor TaxID=1586634 RepID=A0AAV8ZCB8_9CUCU|nr:hypothetical protein NQ314_005796 [Rhamnusium bicolor]
MFKFAVKVGLATTAVYYINEQGVWRNSNESVRTYEKFKDTIKPYIQDVKSQIPIELPTLPETDKWSSLVKQSWNSGVLTTFKFISELPRILNNWSAKGIDAALQNPNIKNVVESFTLKKVEKK